MFEHLRLDLPECEELAADDGHERAVGSRFG